MITLRKSDERGHFDFGWLSTFHTFSFGDYYDPKHMQFGHLRVINEDVIQAGEGFPTHPHRDMEILTYVVSGALAHKDSLGNGSTILPGQIQYMSAGRGVTHSEYNASNSSPTHLLQIWIVPNERSAQPRYGQQETNVAHHPDEWVLLASSTGEKSSIAIRQNAKLFAARLKKGKTLSYELRDRQAWIQLIHGECQVQHQRLSAGDGAAIQNESLVTVTAEADAEFLWFDLLPEGGSSSL